MINFILKRFLFIKLFTLLMLMFYPTMIKAQDDLKTCFCKLQLNRKIELEFSLNDDNWVEKYTKLSKELSDLQILLSNHYGDDNEKVKRWNQRTKILKEELDKMRQVLVTFRYSKSLYDIDESTFDINNIKELSQKDRLYLVDCLGDKYSNNKYSNNLVEKNNTINTIISETEKFYDNIHDNKYKFNKLKQYIDKKDVNSIIDWTDSFLKDPKKWDDIVFLSISDQNGIYDVEKANKLNRLREDYIKTIEKIELKELKESIKNSDALKELKRLFTSEGCDHCNERVENYLNNKNK